MSEVTIVSIKRYPNSDRVRLKLSDGNVVFYRGEASEPTGEAFEVSGGATEEEVAPEPAAAVDLVEPPPAPVSEGQEEDLSNPEGNQADGGVEGAEEVQG